MVYQNKVVAAIKVNGKILREVGTHVYIPFGSEYSIFVKNLNPVRIKFRVDIDGTDQTEGTWLVVPPNSNVELERSIKNANWNAGNRFKFIERSAQVEEHRGIKADDGIVRVEFQTEIPPPVFTHYFQAPLHPRRRKDDYVPPRSFPFPVGGGRRWSDRGPTMGGGLRSRSIGPSGQSVDNGVDFSVYGATSNFATGGVVEGSVASCYVAGASAPECVVPANDMGITVEGSVSNQSFVASSWFQTGASEVICLVLRGAVNGKPIRDAVTVKTRTACKTCGKSSPAGEKFCSGCGAGLQIV